MDDIPLPHSAKLILTDPASLPLLQEQPEHFAAAIAPTPEALEHFAACELSCPIGLALLCPPVPEEDCPRPRTEIYIERCKQAFRPLLHEDAAFYYLSGAETFAALRAAVLALGELCGRGVIAGVTIADDEGRLSDGTEIVAVAGVLQRIGVSMLILTADTPENLENALETAAPYARMSLGAAVPEQWLRDGLQLPNAEIVLPAAGSNEKELLQTLKRCLYSSSVPRDHDDVILAPDGKHAHFISPTVDISDEIECSAHLGETLLMAEEECGAFKLLLEGEDDVVALEECQYMLVRPVCLCAESAELLEMGLRIYPGLALYDGTWEQEKDVLHYLETKYGLICL